MTIAEIISGLKFTIEMFLFDPNTGEKLTEPRNNMDKITLDACKGAIKALEQQPKTGRWIRWYEVIESADGKSTDHIPHCKCSECSTKYDPHSSQFIKYCPNCGAKMQEVEG